MLNKKVYELVTKFGTSRYYRTVFEDRTIITIEDTQKFDVVKTPVTVTVKNFELNSAIYLLFNKFKDISLTKEADYDKMVEEEWETLDIDKLRLENYYLTKDLESSISYKYSFDNKVVEDLDYEGYDYYCTNVINSRLSVLTLAQSTKEGYLKLVNVVLVINDVVDITFYTLNKQIVSKIIQKEKGDK